MSAYRASPTRRPRRTQAEMERIRAGLEEIVSAEPPMSVRGAFYQAVSRGLVPKTDDSKGYGTVQRLLVELRRSGQIDYGWIADGTRWMRKPDTYSSAEAALRRTAETYRRALWDDSPVAVELWAEKEALAGVFVDVTGPWDVPLMVTRGYPSMSFLHSAAVAIFNRYFGGEGTGDAKRQRTQIYYFGDHDPSGVDIDRAIRKGIGESLASLMEPDEREPTPEEEFDYCADFERVAVTEAQIAALNLPTRPTKRNPKNQLAKKFEGRSVELDAIPAATLRAMARECIERHVDQHELRILRTAEAEERRLLMQMAATFNGEEEEEEEEEELSYDPTESERLARAQGEALGDIQSEFIRGLSAHANDLMALALAIRGLEDDRADELYHRAAKLAVELADATAGYLERQLRTLQATRSIQDELLGDDDMPPPELSE